MQDYSYLHSGENREAKSSLFLMLKKAIDDGDIKAAEVILTSKNQYLQEVLGKWITDNNDGKVTSVIFLTYAIVFGRMDIAQAILDIENQNTLKTLLEEMSTLQFPTYAHKLTALSLAEQKDYTVLAEKIKAKMKELEISDKEDELIKSDENLGSIIDYMITSEAKTFICYTSLQSLCLDVLFRDDEGVNFTLKKLRALDSTFIGDKLAQQLANKENKEILTEIQTAQAVRIAILGFAMVVLAVTPIAAIVLAPKAALIIGVVTFGAMGVVGVAGVGVAIFHRYKEIPYTQVEEVGTSIQANVGAKET